MPGPNLQDLIVGRSGSAAVRRTMWLDRERKGVGLSFETRTTPTTNFTAQRRSLIGVKLKGLK